jgi:hypothetical protein
MIGRRPRQRLRWTLHGRPSSTTGELEPRAARRRSGQRAVTLASRWGGTEAPRPSFDTCCFSLRTDPQPAAGRRGRRTREARRAAALHELSVDAIIRPDFRIAASGPRRPANAHSRCHPSGNFTPWQRFPPNEAASPDCSPRGTARFARLGDPWGCDGEFLVPVPASERPAPEEFPAGHAATARRSPAGDTGAVSG